MILLKICTLGHNCLEESQQPLHYLLSQLNGLLDRSTQDLGRLLNSRSWLGNALNTALSMLPAGMPRTLRNVFEQSHQLKHYLSQLDDAQQGSLQTRLRTLLDENGDGLLSPQEIQQAQQKPWQQQPLAGLAIRMDSEWKWNKAKWDSLDGLANHTVNCPNTPWAAQKERIEQLSWWDEVAARSDRLGADASVWHIHPGLFYTQFEKSNRKLIWMKVVVEEFGYDVAIKFKEKIIQVASRLKVDPDYIMACIALETGRSFRTNERNPHSSATGLIQFMAATAIELGTTTDQLALMSHVEQMDYVEKYFVNQARNTRTRTESWSLGDMYFAIFTPAIIRMSSDDVVYKRGDRAYAVNVFHDKNRDGEITRREIEENIELFYEAGLPYSW